MPLQHARHGCPERGRCPREKVDWENARAFQKESTETETKASKPSTELKRAK